MKQLSADDMAKLDSNVKDFIWAHFNQTIHYKAFNTLQLRALNIIQLTIIGRARDIISHKMRAQS